MAHDTRPTPPVGREARRRRPGATAADLAVGRRLRERRLELGLTQQCLAELIGVSWRQAHQYETGVTRVSAGRLHRIAWALGVEVEYLFAAVDPDGPLAPGPEGAKRQRRLWLGLARDFVRIGRPREQEALCALARALAALPGPDEGPGEADAGSARPVAGRRAPP